MQLKLKRSQREGGIVSSTAIFCLDARVEFTAAENQSIRRYKLARQVIYNSEASRKHLDRADRQSAGGSMRGNLNSLASVALAAMKLNITIMSLERGQHIECKSLDELLGAEDAILTACQNLKGYLGTAATFDGREVVFDFTDEEPRVVAHATTPGPTLIASPPAIPSPTAIPQSTTTSTYAESGDAGPTAWRGAQMLGTGFSPASAVAYVSDRANRPKLLAAAGVALLIFIIRSCGYY